MAAAKPVAAAAAAGAGAAGAGVGAMELDDDWRSNGGEQHNHAASDIGSQALSIHEGSDGPEPGDSSSSSSDRAPGFAPELAGITAAERRLVDGVAHAPALGKSDAHATADLAFHTEPLLPRLHLTARRDADALMGRMECTASLGGRACSASRLQWGAATLCDLAQRG